MSDDALLERSGIANACDQAIDGWQVDR